eukprot:TRINITY_DN76034_c0_g1_i1.p1 TRINITY_DN76034_c0_g1~~TRINITY_DN76034_c0_g1_i1.p1  ORF type:complete len:231 (-),score=31.46 TRINITY_DN76034_c0_g1_i1:100-792(-)
MPRRRRVEGELCEKCGQKEKMPQRSRCRDCYNQKRRNAKKTTAVHSALNILPPEKGSYARSILKREFFNSLTKHPKVILPWHSVTFTIDKATVLNLDGSLNESAISVKLVEELSDDDEEEEEDTPPALTLGPNILAAGGVPAAPKSQPAGQTHPPTVPVNNWWSNWSSNHPPNPLPTPAPAPASTPKMSFSPTQPEVTSMQSTCSGANLFQAERECRASTPTTAQLNQTA